MTDYDEMLQRCTWNEVVETILIRIVAELPLRATGSANALLSETLKYFYERGATAVIERDAQFETSEASGDAAATRH